MTEKDVIGRMRKSGLFGRIIRFVPGPYSPAGIPDTYFHFDNEGYWMEIKMGKLKTTPAQDKFLQGEKRALLLRVDSKAERISIKASKGVPDDVVKGLLIGLNLLEYSTTIEVL